MTKIRQAFKDVLIDVDSVKKETTDVFMSIKKIMEIYPKDKIAYRPPSIAMLGPIGSGKDKIAEHFSKQ